MRKTRRSRERPRLTYEDQIKRVLSDGKFKSTRHRRKCMKRLMSVEEAKEVCKSREKWRSILSAYPARDMAWWYVCMYVFITTDIQQPIKISKIQIDNWITLLCK